MNVQSSNDFGFKIDTTKDNKSHNHVFILYGDPGVGKTHTISNLLGKTLLADVEGGSTTLSPFDIDVIRTGINQDGSLIPEHEKFDQFGTIYSYLTKPETIEKYDNIVIDSLTEVSQQILAKYRHQFKDPKDTLRLYGEVGKTSVAFFKAMKDLSKYYNIIFIALAEDERDEIGRRTKAISMVGKTSQIVPAYADFVFYQRCYRDEDGILSRDICTVSDGTFVAKSRSNKLSAVEPPDWSVIMGKINGNLEKN